MKQVGLTPDYFLHIPTNKFYPCVGTDDGKYWAQIQEVGEATGFDAGDCIPMSEEKYKATLVGKLKILNNG